MAIDIISNTTANNNDDIIITSETVCAHRKKQKALKNEIKESLNINGIDFICINKLYNLILSMSIGMIICVSYYFMKSHTNHSDS